MRDTERQVQGYPIDRETRCVHYHGPTDIIAIKFYCCGEYYPCFECHTEGADHGAERWPQNLFEEPAVLCGLCRTELTTSQYLGCDSKCPHCGAAFNPGCKAHWELYFELESFDERSSGDGIGS